MPNEMTSDMEFENVLNTLHGDDLTKLVARTLYNHCADEAKQEERIVNLEAQGHKLFGVTGGLSAILGGAIIAVINHFGIK